jgi:hypothetical protein
MEKRERAAYFPRPQFRFRIVADTLVGSKAVVELGALVQIVCTDSDGEVFERDRATDRLQCPFRENELWLQGSTRDAPLECLWR